MEIRSIGATPDSISAGNTIATQLPRIKCPRGHLATPEGSPKPPKSSPRTPRRKNGRLSAGAALTFFSLSPGSSPHSAAERATLFGFVPAEPSLRHGYERGLAHAGSSQSAEARDPRLESSDAANEDLLLFFYQLDLGMRLQRALNLDQYEPAQQLREKIAEVEMEVTRMREAKFGGTPSREDAQDKGLQLLSLKAELQRAVEEERYGEAAELKNSIVALESDTLAASAAALAGRSREYKFRLGQRVCHRYCGYKGVVAGMDPVCCEGQGWRRAAGLSSAAAAGQPFYQVLVDVKEGLGFPVAYVPEASLEAAEETTKERFDHPYVYLLFYGMDAAGDFIPCQKLREKYGAQRHELPYSGDEGEGSGGSGQGLGQ